MSRLSFDPSTERAQLAPLSSTSGSAPPLNAHEAGQDGKPLGQPASATQGPAQALDFHTPEKPTPTNSPLSSSRTSLSQLIATQKAKRERSGSKLLHQFATTPTHTTPTTPRSSPVSSSVSELPPTHKSTTGTTEQEPRQSVHLTLGEIVEQLATQLEGLSAQDTGDVDRPANNATSTPKADTSSPPVTPRSRGKKPKGAQGNSSLRHSLLRSNGHGGTPSQASDAKKSRSGKASQALGVSSEWSKPVGDAHSAKTQATEILWRATLLYELLDFLAQDKPKDVNDILRGYADFKAESFEQHFPPAPYLRDTSLLANAERVAAEYPGAESERLVRLVQTMVAQSKRRAFVETQQQKWPAELRNNAHAPEVRALCKALVETHELALKSDARLPDLIESALAMKDRSLATELALQPYANLSMMLTKCTVLETAMGETVLKPLRRDILTAIEVQTSASARLLEQLLKDPVDPAQVVLLARVEYAKEMTSLSIDSVNATATSSEIKTMLANIETVRQSYLQKDESLLPERVALDAIAERLKETSHRDQ